MNIKPLTLEEAKGSINSEILGQLLKNKNITKQELYNYLLNSSVKEVVLKILPTFEDFQNYLLQMNFKVKY